MLARTLAAASPCHRGLSRLRPAAGCRSGRWGTVPACSPWSWMPRCCTGCAHRTVCGVTGTRCSAVPATTTALVRLAPPQAPVRSVGHAVAFAAADALRPARATPSEDHKWRKCVDLELKAVTRRHEAARLCCTRLHGLQPLPRVCTVPACSSISVVVATWRAIDRYLWQFARVHGGRDCGADSTRGAERRPRRRAPGRAGVNGRRRGPGGRVGAGTLNPQQDTPQPASGHRRASSHPAGGSLTRDLWYVVTCVCATYRALWTPTAPVRLLV